MIKKRIDGYEQLLKEKYEGVMEAEVGTGKYQKTAYCKLYSAVFQEPGPRLPSGARFRKVARNRPLRDIITVIDCELYHNVWHGTDSHPHLLARFRSMR
jgi:hypothetical protein